MDFEKLLDIKNVVIFSFWFEFAITFISLVSSFKFNVPFIGLINIILLLSSFLLLQIKSKYAGAISLADGILMIFQIFKMDIFSFLIGILLTKVSIDHNKQYNWKFDFWR